MNTTTVTPDLARRRSNTTHRWIRQIHLWIGAWGALAAVIYGFTGLVMNHRFGDGAWPQGDSAELGRVVLSVPPVARETPEALTQWLRETHRLDTQTVRKAKPDGAKLAGREVTQPAKWNLSGGTASASWALELVPGNATAEMKQSQHTPLAAFNRLLKGVGGKFAWILLADSFAIGMLLLGLSGLWMRGRGRTPGQMVASVFGLAVLVLAAVLGPVPL